MTVSVTDNRVTQVGNGVTTAVPFNKYFVEQDDLVVENVVIATGVSTPLVLGVDYTISGTPVNGVYENGGTVNLTTAPASTVRTVVTRATDLTQETEYPTSQDPFPATAHENALDKLTLIIQDLQEKLGRALKFPTGSIISGKTVADPETGKYLVWGSDGNISNGTPTAVDLTLPSMTSKDNYPVLVDEGASTFKYGTSAIGALAYLSSVDTAQIAADAVTLANMEHGTSGDVLYYGASGVPTRLAKGTDGQYLGLSSGVPTWETVVGDLFPVRSVTTLSSDAAFTISDIEDYDVNIIDGYHVVPANDDQFLRLQVGIADVIQTSGYEWQTGTADYLSGTANYIATTSDDATATTGIKNSTAGWNFRFHIEIYGAADTSHLKWIEGWVLYRAGNGSAPRRWPFGGWYETSNAAITDIKGFMSSGAFTSGTVVHRAGDLA